jgi:hypothetical protein
MLERDVEGCICVTGHRQSYPISIRKRSPSGGVLADPFGHEWSIATHTKDLTIEEMMKGAEALFSRAE